MSGIISRHDGEAGILNEYQFLEARADGTNEFQNSGETTALSLLNAKFSIDPNQQSSDDEVNKNSILETSPSSKDRSILQGSTSRSPRYPTDRFIPLFPNKSQCTIFFRYSAKPQENIGYCPEMEGGLQYQRELKTRLFQQSRNQVYSILEDNAQKLRGRSINHSRSKSRLLKFQNDDNSHEFLCLNEESERNGAFHAENPTEMSFGSHFEDLINGRQGSAAPKAGSDRCYRILQAPRIVDDFYINVLDWSKTNILAVGLSSSVYLCGRSWRRPQRFADSFFAGDYFTSVFFDPAGEHLALGTNSGEIGIWDIATGKILRQILSHRDRVGVMSWNSSFTFSSGSKDRSIKTFDLRNQHSEIFSIPRAHSAEVCGLKWSPDGTRLASGGNDNRVSVWSGETLTSECTFSGHTGAIRALGWYPHKRGILISGGGYSDKSLRVWNMACNEMTSCILTCSQICNVAFSNSSQDFVTSHGYPHNHLILWKFPSLTATEKLDGHSSRVLYMAASPDGQSICTGSADETIKLWRVFPQMKNSSRSGSQNPVIDPKSLLHPSALLLR